MQRPAGQTRIHTHRKEEGADHKMWEEKRHMRKKSNELSARVITLIEIISPDLPHIVLVADKTGMTRWALPNVLATFILYSIYAQTLYSILKLGTVSYSFKP